MSALRTTVALLVTLTAVAHSNPKAFMAMAAGGENPIKVGSLKSTPTTALDKSAQTKIGDLVSSSKVLDGKEEAQKILDEKEEAAQKAQKEAEAAAKAEIVDGSEMVRLLVGESASMCLQAVPQGLLKFALCQSIFLMTTGPVGAALNGFLNFVYNVLPHSDDPLALGVKWGFCVKRDLAVRYKQAETTHADKIKQADPQLKQLLDEIKNSKNEKQTYDLIKKELSKRKWPIVSVPTGKGTKYVLKNIDIAWWIGKIEKLDSPDFLNNLVAYVTELPSKVKIIAVRKVSEWLKLNSKESAAAEMPPDVKATLEKSIGKSDSKDKGPIEPQKNNALAQDSELDSVDATPETRFKAASRMFSSYMMTKVAPAVGQEAISFLLIKWTICDMVWESLCQLKDDIQTAFQLTIGGFFQLIVKSVREFATALNERNRELSCMEKLHILLNAMNTDGATAAREHLIRDCPEYAKDLALAKATKKNAGNIK